MLVRIYITIFLLLFAFLFVSNSKNRAYIGSNIILKIQE
ncbi:hypothetical protein FFONT_0287 [Fervidicoccus fontis Kam940]|uniref:Uncharacterized protein n=1 Tax=Fervidicoccus fontis (strain DSM 19380 / JCM 18336 / VKM B-2539 / Kam940) TaxID=1163730 RepID=H9ZZX0_FERFK|nr:hypothetical protein FFONT_0287 [Fervidicoccus fontis Kam940]